jgi:hypothetical protein
VPDHSIPVYEARSISGCKDKVKVRFEDEIARCIPHNEAFVLNSGEVMEPYSKE